MTTGEETNSELLDDLFLADDDLGEFTFKDLVFLTELIDRSNVISRETPVVRWKGDLRGFVVRGPSRSTGCHGS